MSTEPLRPGDLVAIADPPGPRWLAHVTRAWRADAAVLPLDHRLSNVQRATLIAAARPTVLQRPSGSERLDGEPVTAGTGLVIATSGTTGPPKAVELSRDALESAVRASAARLGLHGRESWCCPIPVAHIGGMLVVIRGVILGCPITFDLTTRTGWASVVPTHLRRLVDAGEPLDHRSFLVGGDRLDASLAVAARERGARIVHTYGMTETAGGVVYDGTPIDDVTVRLGERNRIELASPTLFTRYRDGQPTGITDGWLGTTDHGAIDEDGRLVVHGRLDRLVVIGGENVDPDAVATTVRALPGVTEVSVEAVGDPEYGTRLAITVQGSPDDAAIRDAVAHAHSRLVATTATIATT